MKYNFPNLKFSLILLAFFVAASTSFALEIERHGITWTITGTPTSGTYANGDPWVVGPITITAISPTPTAGRNGTMVNPQMATNWTLGAEHGFDSRIPYNTYDEALNVGNDLPLAVSAESFVVSSISETNTVDWGQVQMYAILTVVTSDPGANHFRPSYISPDWSHPLDTANVNFAALPDMDATAISSEPTLVSLTDDFQYFWFEIGTQYRQRSMHTTYQAHNGYGKEMAIKTGNAILSLSLDYTDGQKADLLYQILQYGIDIHGIIDGGHKWNEDGGHNVGRFGPAIVAAKVFNDATMLGNISETENNFQELRQTFLVTQADIDQARYTADGRPRTPYTSEDIGKPEWGERHEQAPARDGDNWDAYYRDIAGGQLQAPAIVAYLMGASSDINDSAFFGYAERHIYYRQGRYTNPVYYNGYDDGDAYGDGNTGSSNPFGANETPSFHSAFYLEFEDAEPVGATDDLTGPVVSNATVIKTATTATIEYDTDEGATSYVEWDTDTGAPYSFSDSVSGLRSAHSVDLDSQGALTAETTYYYRIVTEDSFANSTTETEGNFTTDAAGSTPAATPTFSPVAGNYWETQNVVISGSDTPDTIRYTTDGSNPSVGSSAYSTAIAVIDGEASTRLKAYSEKTSFSDSAIATADYSGSPWFVENTAWTNIVYPTETTAFTETVYVATFESEASDPVMGFGLTADNYNDLAIMWRRNGGVVEVRNGASYTADISVSWPNDVVLRFELSDVVFGTSFDLEVSVEGGPLQKVANDYAWRSDWTGSTTIDSFGAYDALGGVFTVQQTANESLNLLETPVRILKSRKEAVFLQY